MDSKIDLIMNIKNKLVSEFEKIKTRKISLNNEKQNINQKCFPIKNSVFSGFSFRKPAFFT